MRPACTDCSPRWLRRSADQIRCVARREALSYWPEIGIEARNRRWRACIVPTGTVTWCAANFAVPRDGGARRLVVHPGQLGPGTCYFQRAGPDPRPGHRRAVVEGSRTVD